VTPDPILASLRAAVDAAPDDVVLRLHLAQLLEAAGQHDDAVREAAEILRRDPTNVPAIALISRAATVPEPTDGDESETDILRRLDAELADVVPPQFVDGDQEPAAFEVERTGLKLADVGGMVEVKRRLEASVLAPLRNPELGRLYGKSLRVAAVRTARLRQDVHRAGAGRRDGRPLHGRVAGRRPRHVHRPE
jgi:hypothetical protein